jgi:hypothetical protein
MTHGWDDHHVALAHDDRVEKLPVAGAHGCRKRDDVVFMRGAPRERHRRIQPKPAGTLATGGRLRLGTASLTASTHISFTTPFRYGRPASAWNVHSSGGASDASCGHARSSARSLSCTAGSSASRQSANDSVFAVVSCPAPRNRPT